MNSPIRALILSSIATVALLTPQARSALVGGTGYTSSFATRPAVADWSTYSVTGTANDVYDLTNVVQGFAAATIKTQLPDSSPADPPNANTRAAWTSGGTTYVCTRPLANKCIFLMTTLVNNTGTNATSARIVYDLDIKAPTLELDYPGLRAFYSLSGLSNSWVAIQEFSSPTPVAGRLEADLSFGTPWDYTSTLYVLWVDDNAGSGTTNSVYLLDNFFAGITAGTSTSTALGCTLRAPANGTAFLPGASIMATTLVQRGTAPFTVEYFTNSGVGNTVFASAGSSATAPYNVSLGSLSLGKYNLYAVVTDSASTPASTNSLTNTFTVADRITVTLTAPEPDATFEYTAPVVGAAAVAGGTPPYAVQFFLDYATNGSPVTTAPYEHNFGTVPPGDHTLRAMVRDAAGWASYSEAQSIHIIGPLTAVLTPTNGALLNYGQSVNLNVGILYGTAPFTVTFYAADEEVGTLGGPPYTVSLGMLPVGSYTSYVYAVDSTVPAPRQAYSTTNVITILDNPLVVTLTGATNGQSLGQGSDLRATATVGTPVTVSRIEFFLDEVSLGADNTAPYAVSLGNPSLGSHSAYAVATDSLGRTSSTATNQVTVLPSGCLVGPGGYTNSFDMQPPPSEWMSSSRGGGSTDNYSMDSDVNANITASGVTNRTTSDPASPAAANANATWSPTGFYLQTRPTGNRYTVLMSKFMNVSGTNATEITLSYQFTIAAGGTGEDTDLGTRVYYSLTGQTNSWVNLPTFSTTSQDDSSTLMITNLALNWTNGAILYLLWADDNAAGAGGSADPAQQIDNFALRVTAGLPPSFTCRVEVPTNGAVWVSGTALTAAASVVYGVEPYLVEFFTNSGVGNTVFQSAGTSGTQPYQASLGSLSAGSYNIYAVATDSSGTPAVTNSVTNTFVVADPINITLVTPAQDASIDHLSSVEGIATVSGGVAPYAVQFYLDEVAQGAPVTSPPYSYNFGTLFVGDHTIRATVMDATGWEGSSVAHTINITGPLAVMFTPTNGASFNYGQPLVLTVIAGGGSGPYTLTFYANDEPVGSLSSRPFVLDLGVLPTGGYTCRVHAVDSSTPAAQQADSSTQIITILDNPLGVTLTSPIDGQTAQANVTLTLAANATVAAPLSVTNMQFFVDGVPVGSDSTAPYSFPVVYASEGTRNVYAVATDSVGRVGYSATNRVTFILNPLANNNFFNAIPLSAAVVTTTGRNLGASKENREPNHGGNRGGASLWWSWTAPASGAAVIDTEGSDFNTLLGVYTGNRVNGLSTIAGNNDYSGNPWSRVEFTAVAGTVYMIAVDGYSTGFGQPAATGNIVLHVKGPGGVTIDSPTNGMMFIVGEPIPVAVSISTNFLNPPATRVDFYLGGSLFASSTTAPFSAVASNALLGVNQLYVAALDSAGLLWTSAVVNVRVLNEGVTLLSPADGTTYLNTNPIPVSAVGLLRSGSITNVEFFVDGQKFGEDDSLPFSAVWNTVAGGSHRLTAVGQSDTGASYTSEPANIAVAQALVLSDSVWKYRDDGSDQGSAWIAPEFDDSGWASGPAPLGYGDSNGRLVLTTNSYGPDENNKFVTTYYRQSFVASNAANYSALVVSIQRDDGAIVYLNGAEVGRFNMPNGAVTYTNWASGNATDDGSTTFSAVVSPALLREGANVFAVEIHQDAGDSSDIWFVMELLGVPPIIHNQYPAVALTTPSDGTVAVAPASLSLRAEASDSDGWVTKVEFFANGLKLGETTNAPYGLEISDLPAGSYLLTAVATDNQGGSQASAPATVSVYLATSRWAAYNDHYAGPGTHPNATAWNAFGTDGGAPGNEGSLRNLATGTALPASLTIEAFNAFADTAAGAPTPGTPAYETFNGYVDFGSGNVNNAILVNGDSLVLHLFTGLDPNHRYSFRGTAVGGVASYSNRWTLVTIVGAESFAAAHTAHVLTSATEPALATDEAAMNTGNNLSGDMVGWDNIAPGPDGSFLILSSQYRGPAPGNAHPGPMACAPVAVRLEEFGTLPLVQMTSPPDGYVNQGPTNVVISAFARAVSGISQVEFLADGVLLGSVATSPYNFNWADVPFGTHRVEAVALDTQGLVSTSAPISLTVTIPPTNTVPPYIFGQNPTADSTVTNLTTIQVTFTEPVVGVDASDLLVNGVPATNVVGTLSNYVFSFAQPAYGSVRIGWAENHGIRDCGWPEPLGFYEYDTGASWTYNLIDRIPPTVVSKTPAAGAALTNLTQIGVTFSEAVAGVDASDLLVNGTPAYDVEGTGASYSFAVSQPSSGTVAITWATNHGIIDLAPAQNPFNGSGPGATWTFTLDARTILIQSNSFWLFVTGTNEASIPTNVWRELSFDDSSWSNAPAPFFYGDPYSNGVPAYTLLSDMRSNYTSIYLRKTFVVPNASGITNLFLRGQIDDGMVVWINGVEVLRTNVGAGDLSYDATALTASQEPQNNGAAYVNYGLPDPRAYLRSGTNVIAVQALNESLTASSDFGFNAQLYTYQTDTEAVAPHVAQKEPAAGYLFELTNLTVAFSEPVTNVDAADLLINGAPTAAVTSVSNTVFTFSFAQPAYGAVSITWAANHGITDLDIEPKPFNAALPSSSWGYSLLNPNSPTFFTVAPLPQATVNTLTQIALTFSEPVTGVDAADLLLNGVPATGLSGSGTNYTFSFPQPAYGTVYVDWATNHGIRDLHVPANDFDPAWPNHRWNYSLVDQTAPMVASQDPPAGSAVVNLTSLTVSFSEAVSGVSSGDLLINGKPASSVTGSNGTYTFTFPQPNATHIQVSWTANHGIRDRATTPNAFDGNGSGATWSYSTVDSVPPTVASLIPAAFTSVRAMRQVILSFDEPIQGATAGSLTVNGAAALHMSGSGAGPYTFEFDAPATGVVQVALSGALWDLAAAPNQYAGSNWTYVLNPDLPLPTVTRGPYLQLRTTNSMIVRWRTGTASDSSVLYGLDADSRTNAVNDPTVTTEHIVTVTNLQADTRYVYAIGTTDGSLLTDTNDTNFCWVTAPSTGISRPTRVWFISDYGYANDGERSVRDCYFNYISAEKPADVWLTGGDNDQINGSDANAQNSIFGTNYGYGNLLRKLPNCPTFGNHDYQTSQGQAYFANFSLPTQGEAGGVRSGSENYYSFDYNDIHFISLDSIVQSNSVSSDTVMLRWLKQDLDSTAQRWIIAYWHGPPYTKGSHDSDNDSDTLSWMTQMRKNVLPVLEAHGVDLVLCGHSHVYERSWLLNGHYGYSTSFSQTNKLDGGDGRPDGTGAYHRPAGSAGTVYVTAALGSQPQSSSSTVHPAHYLKINSTLGSLVIDVNSNRLDYRFLTISGEALDHFTIDKSPMVAPPAAPANFAASSNGSSAVLTWANNATNELAYHLECSVNGAPFAEIATPGANLTSYTISNLDFANAYYYRLRSWNHAGYSDYSVVASVVPTGALTIEGQPQSVTNQAGTTAAFYVLARGTAPITYQWYHEGMPLFGQTNSSLTLPNVTSSDAGRYFVDLYNGVDEASSAWATLTVTAAIMPPSVVAPPRLANGMFSVGFQGTPGVTYTIQSSETPSGSWQNRTNVIAPPDGIILIQEDTQTAPRQFYRLVYPPQQF
jgi:acid phosphatase type 7